MGVIYSVEEVGRGRVPGPGAHEVAAAEVIERIADSEAFPAAMIYGSVVTGGAVTRSDLDVCIGYRTASDLEQARRTGAEILDKFFVHVEWSKVRLDDQLEQMAHDPLYDDHLRRVAGHEQTLRTGDMRLLLGSLTGRVVARQLPVYCARYADSKEKKLTDALTKKTVDIRRMQRGLELPSAIGRKAIPMFTAVPASLSSAESDRQAANKSVREHLERLTDDGSEAAGGALDQHDKLTTFDNDLTQLLGEVVDGTASIADYAQWIDEHYVPTLEAAAELAHAYVLLANWHYQAQSQV